MEAASGSPCAPCLETGARIGFNRSVPVGSEVVIDTANRRATIDGQSDVSRWLQFREWELVPAGASRTFQFDATGVVVETGTPVESRRNRFKNTLTGANVLNLAASRGTLSAQSGFNRVTVTDNLVGTFTQRIEWVAGNRIPVVANERFAVDVEVRTTMASAIGLGFLFYDSGGTAIGSLNSAPGTAATGSAWVPTSHAAIAPAGAASALVYIGPIGNEARAIGDTIDARRITDAGIPWFNGSSAPTGDRSYLWAGTVDASESIEMRTPQTITASLEGQVRSAWW